MKKRILSLVLCAALLLSLCLFMGAGVAVDAPATEDFVPAVNFTNVAPLVQANAQAANSPARAPMLTANVNAVTTRAADNGVVTSKTAAKNADGTYTITLEAYATGSKVISEIQKDVPTDIVLVLDQSGSMKNDMGTVKYDKYKDKNSTNADNYGRRHNGGSANLWYKLSDGSYVPVYAAKSQVYNALPTNLKNSVWNSSNCYWNYRNSLYEKVGDAYQKVTVDFDGLFDGTYTYTFSDGTKVVSEGNSSVPNFGAHAPLYTLAEDGSSTVYTYTYTDANGVTQTIGTSTGASTKYAQFYQRSVSSSGGGTRLAALKTAATEFATSVATKAAGKDGVLGTEDDIDHRIAVVGFADTDDDYGYNTGVFIGSKMTKYKNASNVYATALQSMKTTDGQNNVTASLGALKTSGATRTDLGLVMAKGILDANPVPADQTRNRVVIVFTDGSPTDFNGFQVNVANSAITTANEIKSGGATVYGIGIFAGADATSPGTKPTSDLGNNSSALPAACNWFMQNLSSNNGVVQNPSYYLSAADAESLKNIFKQISDQIETGGSSSTLTGDAVVKDIISQQFCLPAGTTAEKIRLQTYACTGKTGDTYQWSATSNGNMGAVSSIQADGQVSVTGFDFAGNWCGVETQTDGTEISRGYKLVISFEVVPKDGFLGGNDVFTNANAAIYANSTSQLPVATFERPQVNVPIQSVTVTAAEQNVYLLGGVTADQLKAGATASVGGVSLNLSADNYGLEAWQTEYVDITVKVMDAKGNVITDLSALKDDVTYSVVVTVAPKTQSSADDAATEQTGSNTANVNVFKPELTFKDSEGYYGDTAPGFDGNLTATVWKHGETEANTAVMGAAPALTLTYTPDTDAIVDGKINTRTDFGVAAAVKIGETDVTANTAFGHTSCEGKTCTPPEGKAFLFHVKTCSLTISKTVKGDGANPNQTFVFDVKDSTGKLVTTIVLKDGEHKTITGLAVGTYTVTEDTSWSWSYSIVDGNDKSAALSGTTPSAEVAVTNHYDSHNWLTSIADVINKWVSATQIQQIPAPETN